MDAVDGQDAHDRRRMRPKKSWNGVMSGHKLEMTIASALLIFPMVILCAVLLGLIHTHRMPDNNSSYSYDNKTALPLDSAYFVNYSSTTLVYIASVSSTLSTLFVPAAMLLYSFSLASDFARDSDRSATRNLPSPYQLEMIIRMIDGRFMVIWSYIAYLFGSKRRRTDVVPMLWHAFAMFMTWLLLALLIFLADLWLHLDTKTVQYLELKPEQPSIALTPGRGFNSTCLNNPYPQTRSTAACILEPNDAVNPTTLLGQTEFYKTAANSSEINQVYLSNGFAFLGPVNPDPDLDFEASTFASKSACRAVTGLCGAQSTANIRTPIPSTFNFMCNASVAGLNMTGSFANILNTSSTLFEVSNKSVMNDPNYPPGLKVLGANTMYPSNQIQFQYFNDAQKQNQTAVPDFYFGIDGGSDDIIPGNLSQLYWATVWAVPFSSPLNQVGAELAAEDVASVSLDDVLYRTGTSQGGGSAGILSCETNISEITYSFTKGIMAVTSSKPPRENASIPFITAITAQWGYDQLRQGMQVSFAGAKSPEDFAARFANVYDQTMMAIPAGVMLSLPATNVTRRIESTVTRVPQAPFLALVLLDLIYAATGFALTLIALFALTRGRSVRDAQVRLSVAALVAESFESPALGDDAKKIDDLYAERRGLTTRRVTLGKKENGGRRYGQIGMMDERNDRQRLLKGGLEMQPLRNS